jgi:hypothetical protein
MSYGAVIVETRERVDLPRVIEQHMVKLPSDWGLTVFTNGLSEIQVKQSLPHARVIDIRNVACPIIRYSFLLTSLRFLGGAAHTRRYSYFSMTAGCFGQALNHELHKRCIGI